MGENSTIEWTDHTFNSWVGCTKVSPGCAHCYAEARDQRFAEGKHWGKGAPRQRTSEATWRNPVKWNKFPWTCKCGQHFASPALHDCSAGRYSVPWYEKMHKARVFCASLADWLDDEVPIEWLADLLKLIHDTPNLDWLLLTKRPENWRTRLGLAILECRIPCQGRCGWLQDWINGTPPPSNVWLGTSVEDRIRAERVLELCKIPARIRFVSAEPMLGPIDFTNLQFKEEDAEVRFNALTGESWCENSASPSAYDVHPENKLHWIIFGGESGKGARPCNIDWIRDGVRQCQAAGVSAFVKQLGSNPVDGSRMSFDADRLPLKLKDHKGGDMTEWPEDLRVREFPKVEIMI